MNQINVDWHITSKHHHLCIALDTFPVFQQTCLQFGRLCLSSGNHCINRAVQHHQFCCGLFTHTGNTSQVVAWVAT